MLLISGCLLSFSTSFFGSFSWSCSRILASPFSNPASPVSAVANDVGRRNRLAARVAGAKNGGEINVIANGIGLVFLRCFI